MSQDEDYFILMEDRVDIREFNLVISIIDDIFKNNNLTPLTKNFDTFKSTNGGKSDNKKFVPGVNLKK